jgi:hypothetical protein
MKKYLLLLLTISACRDNSIYKEYHGIKGYYALQDSSNNVLKTLHFSCQASKKLADKEYHGCTGYINGNKADQPKLIFRYKIPAISELNINDVTDRYMGNMDSNDRKIKSLLLGSWKYYQNKDTLVLTGKDSLVFIREK